MVLGYFNSRPGSKLADTARQFNIPEGTVRGWFDEDRRRKEATLVDGDVAVAADPLNMDEIQDSIMLDPTPADMGDDQPPIDLLVVNAAEVMAEPTHEEAKDEANPDTAEHVQQTPTKKTRQRYSNETKIQVILALETRKGRSLNDIAKEFNVAAGTVRGWRDEADKIQKQAMENRRAGAKANPSRDPLKRIWGAILVLFEKNSQLPQSQRLEVNVAVVRTIGTQARDTLLAAHRNSPFLTPTEVASMEKFKASETWARKWAKDHQIFTSRPDKTSRLEFAHTSLERLQKLVGEYQPDCVYTVTSMDLFYRILPHRAYVTPATEDGKRLRACKGLKSKDRLTLYVCTNETGSDKLPISTIGKYENPACFRVAQQKTLPYFSQKHALSDPSTFQMWWRTVFLPHVRKRHPEGQHCLLLVEPEGNSRAEYLKDPTGQVRVEPLPASPSITSSSPSKMKKSDSTDDKQFKESFFPQCQALEHEILDTIKRRYRFRLLQEVMETYGERQGRQKVAKDAQFPVAARGLREGSLANICDSMRLLESIWDEVAQTTVAKAWQRTKLRPKPPTKDGNNTNDEMNADGEQRKKQQHRAKSEKRQNTREKKQLVKDINAFLTQNPSITADDAQGGPLEEMVRYSD
jgi:transposase-like protein